MSLYYNPNGYDNVTAFFTALGQVPNFWDSTSADTLTKDGITVTLTSTTIITISGYNKSVTITSSQANTSYALIAATDTGLVFAFGYVATTTYCGALGVDDNGNWGAATGKLSSSGWTIDTVLADGVTSTTYSAGNTTASDYNTQIVQLTSQHGNFIFKDLMRLLLTSQIGYRGKILLGDTEKYVLAGSFALKYTD
jgi:hypothetical protein